MTLGNILVLCGIVAAFGIFALGLAWGQIQTRRVSLEEKPHSEGALAGFDEPRMAA